MPNFFVLDEREIWHGPLTMAARRAGFSARRIRTGQEARGPGFGFIRPHADWRRLPMNRQDFKTMAERLTMIQDAEQVRLYEDKSGQFAKWGDWMPDTWRFTDLDQAMQFVLEDAPYPLISKADVGASSVNVRILGTREAAAAHVSQLFSQGIVVSHGAPGCPTRMQLGYALLQRFIPHKVTWRVNAIGTKRAAFRRFCYPERNVAQTGNVEPVKMMTAEIESLFEYADRFFTHAGTKWCALDILRDGSKWTLLETSLAWPWPSPGDCNNAPIFGTAHKWIDMFDVLMDEVRHGVFSPASGGSSSARRSSSMSPAT